MISTSLRSVFWVSARMTVMSGCSRLKPALSGLIFSLVLGASGLTSLGGVWAKGPPSQGAASSGLANVTLAELPSQAQEVHGLILRGGPFAYEKDGTVFGNRERQLPGHARGFYREYTVVTPGLRNRGPRRIVCGGESKVPEACYYTDDHYASFRKIVP